MFEYTLENGKKQFRDGLKMLIGGAIGCIVFGILFSILAQAVKTQGGLIAVAVIFSILLILAGIATIMGAIKVIFGAVVYHAERTSSRTANDIRIEQATEDEMMNDDIKNLTPITSVKYSSSTSSLIVNLKNGHKYFVKDFKVEDIKKWNDLDNEKKTKWFYSTLIKKATLK